MPPFSAGTITIGHPEGCCIGIRGNVDGDYCDEIDISDLTYLIDYMFGGGPEPECFEEADINSDCSPMIDIADLIYLINYMFTSGPEPGPCGGCKGSVTTGKTSGSIAVDTRYEQGVTIITLNSPDDLGGLQLELTGDNSDAIPTSRLSGQLDLLHHHHADTLKVGLIDLDGGGYIESGEVEVLRIDGIWEPIEARVATLKGESVIASLGVADEPTVPHQFALHQNYPNPFNPSTTIKFSLPEAGHVNLTIFNVLGQTVTTLVDQFYPAGEYDAMWDSRNDQGQSVSSGVYFYRLDAAHRHETKKMMLLK